MQLVQDYVEANSTIDDIYPAVEPICVVFINRTTHYYGPYMCPGIILSYGPVVSAGTVLVSMATILPSLAEQFWLFEMPSECVWSVAVGGLLKTKKGLSVAVVTNATV